VRLLAQRQRIAAFRVRDVGHHNPWARDEKTIQGCEHVLTMEQLCPLFVSVRTSTAEALCIVTEDFHGANRNVAGPSQRTGEPQAFPDETRAIWLEAFHRVRAETEKRAEHLSVEDQIVQSMADASPAKWHRAHVTWFFEQFLLVPHDPSYRVFDERFPFLFNSYYVAAGP